MIRRKGNVYKLDTPSTTLLIRADKAAEYLYYGERLSVSGSDYEYLSGVGEGNQPTLPLVSSFGADAGRASVACVFADGSFSPRFVFRRAGLAEKPDLSPLPSSYSDSGEKNACQTLCLEFQDEPSKLRLFLYYTVFDDSDVISVSSRLVNGGKKEVRVRNLSSLQLELYGTGAFSSWKGDFEKGLNRVTLPLSAGVFCAHEQIGGSASVFSNAFSMLEKEGTVYAFNLVYSGNYKVTAETDFRNRTRILVGMNDFMLDKVLQPGEAFFSPEAVMAFARNADDVSADMADFVNKHIVRGKWKGRERPVIVDNRDSSGVELRREKLIGLAERTAAAGAEVFVLESGGVLKGDWSAWESERGGIAAFAEAVRKTGLKFGIGIEPETIFENSELFEKHPEFVMRIPGREPVRINGRLLLNLADVRVQKYIVRAVSSLLAETKASYVKWNVCRNMSDCYGRDVPSGEYFLRYTEGLYTVVGKLTEKFPGVLFESDGRFDLGMLCYMPQCRINVCAENVFSSGTGISYGYPQSVLTVDFWRFDGGRAAFDAFSGGSEKIKKQIVFYKKNRRLLQYGRQYRLGCASEEGFIIVSENKASAFVFAAADGKRTGAARISLKGLDRTAMYKTTAFGKDTIGKGKSFVASGELLMNGYIPIENAALEKISVFAVEKLKKSAK